MYSLTICHLYYDLLSMYGDMGNIIALKNRAIWRGIEADVQGISIGDFFDWEKYDIVFLGGGQDFEQEIIQDDLFVNKSVQIKEAIENNKVFLCICGGYQLLGKYYVTPSGKQIEFIGALDLVTESGDKRMIGDAVIKCEFLGSKSNSGIKSIVGFENHSGRTFLGPGVKPLGKVISGFGNNGEDGYEGAVYKNTYCSYLHGSLLPKNPHLTDFLLTTALKQKYDNFSMLTPLNDELEYSAHNNMLNRIMKRR